MAKRSDPLTCPQCGVAMNHHASKRMDPRSREEAARCDELGGWLAEAHSCPECGEGATRRGGAPSAGRRSDRSRG